MVIDSVAFRCGIFCSLPYFLSRTFRQFLLKILDLERKSHLVSLVNFVLNVIRLVTILWNIQFLEKERMFELHVFVLII